jgi:protein-tyrosine phosphatase
VETVLFLCTGNYYRSRFAEEYFNDLAIRNNLNWRADSRGLRQAMDTLSNVGPISVHAMSKLRRLGIKPVMASRFPLSVSMRDFQAASRAIALCEREHRPMMVELFPMFEKSIEYWDVEDLLIWQPSRALKAIQQNVESLINELVPAPQLQD